MKTESGLLPNCPTTSKNESSDGNSIIERCKNYLTNTQLMFPENDCNAHKLLLTLLQMKNKDYIIRVEKENWGNFKLFILSEEDKTQRYDCLHRINGFYVSNDSLYIAYLIAIMQLI